MTSARITEILGALPIPEGSALVATGSYARGEMTAYSDVDLILLHREDTDLSDVGELWYSLWDAKVRCDYAIRTERECVAMIGQDTASALALVEMVPVVGDEELAATVRASVLRQWRRYVHTHFDAVTDAAIARWRRSGAVVTMTRPDIKNGRGGLRDIDLMKALGLGHVCNVPDMSTERGLLLEIRQRLHYHARRARDVLDPEFAVDIALELGFSDRYALLAALGEASRTVDRELTGCLEVARGVVSRRGGTKTQRRPLDVDVVEAGGEVALAKNRDIGDPGLVLRVAAAAARHGLPVQAGVWETLRGVPPLPTPWPPAAVADFFALLSAPDHAERVIAEMDAHGYWVPLVPGWDRIRGAVPREPIHKHTIDVHSLKVVSNCAASRVSVARPDLLTLAALFHDMGKGYGRPHEEVGAELVGQMAAIMRLSHQDAAMVTMLVRQHTLIPKLVATADPEDPVTINTLLEGLGYSLLGLNLLCALVEADAKGTGDGVFTTTLEVGMRTLADHARARLTAFVPSPPVVGFGGEIALYPGPRSQARIFWSGTYWRESVRVFALLSAKQWSIKKAEMVCLDGEVRAQFDVRNTAGTRCDERELIHGYHSGVFSAIPPIPAAATATAWRGNLLEVRTVDRHGALGTLLGVLPDFRWMTMTTPGAMMVVQCALHGGCDRVRVERDIMRVLGTG